VPNGETLSLRPLILTMSSVSGMVSGDFSAVELWADSDNNGTIGGSDTQVGGSGTVSIVGGNGTTTFTTAISVSAATNYIMRADIANLNPGDKARFSLAVEKATSSGATSLQVVTPTTTPSSVLHEKLTGSSGGSSIGDNVPASLGNQGTGGGGGGGEVGGGPPPSGGNQGGGGGGGGGEVRLPTGTLIAGAVETNTLANEQGWLARIFDFVFSMLAGIGSILKINA